MARPLRIEYNGAFYHVINRGLERREIFCHPKDYEYFLGLLVHIYEKYGIIVHAFCLMPNHYHLFLQTPNGNLSKAIRQLDGNHTQKFNKRHKRVGPLFQGRYKAVLIDVDSYSLQLAKYIHLNPVKAKIASKPEDYLYSSYSSYIGKAKAPSFLDSKWLLSQYAKSKTKAIKELKRHTLEAEEEDWMPEKDTFKSLILGNSDFIEQIQETYLAGKKDSEISKLTQIQKQLAPADILKFIERMGINKSLTSKLYIYALKTHTQLSLQDIGGMAGHIHYSTVSHTAGRLLLASVGNKTLKKAIADIDNFCAMSKAKT